MVLDLLLIGIAITLEPFPLSAFVLILGAERGAIKGVAFIVGWLACLVAVIAAVVLATGGEPPAQNPVPSDAALAVKLAAYVVLIVLAWRQWRRMGRPRQPPQLRWPGWIGSRCWPPPDLPRSCSHGRWWRRGLPPSSTPSCPRRATT